MVRDRIRRGARLVKQRLKRKLFGADETVVPVETASVVVQEAPVVAPVVAAEPEPVVEPETPSDDVVGKPITMESVALLFEDMVRPALQSDGGDLDLIKVENNSVWVRLTGACSTCPSSTVTMKMGIERLLVEEFPQFGTLHQVPS